MVHRKGYRLAALLLSLMTALLSISPVQALESPVRQLSYADAKAVIDLGSYGFFQSRGSVDAMNYMNWYNNQLSSSDAYQNGQKTDYGDPNDATSLENMKAALGFIKQANSLRAAHGKGPFLVSDTLMAIAQINCNASATIRGHESMARNAGLTNRMGENMTVSYADPFDFWYVHEKAIFDSSGSSGATGHFENLINPLNKGDLNYTVTGFAVNTQYLNYNASNPWANGNVTSKTYIQEFSMTSGTGWNGFTFPSERLYTVEEYEKDFLAYYNRVYADYNAAYDEYLNARTENIRAFVTRLYRLCLDREPDSGGLRNWTNQLYAGVMTAADVVQRFFLSKEMQNRKLSNEEFVERCYLVMLDRKSDKSGKKHWLTRLENGVTYMHILYGFVGSQEFAGICSSYGIEKGTIPLSDPRDINYGVTSFVARCYTETLGRKYDQGGLINWCNYILSASNRKEQAIKTASDGFFHSKEFKNKKLSNTEYVKVLYRTFLGREYDESGLKYWVNHLKNKTKTRDEVLYGFAYSQEFSAIMAKYGL